jgi:hypothetical protein
LEFQYVVAPNVHPLTTIHIYHEYYYYPPQQQQLPDEEHPYGIPAEPARQRGHYTALLPPPDYFRHLPGVDFDPGCKRFVFLPFPFLTTLRTNLYNYSILRKHPLPHHLLKQESDDKIYSTEPGYNEDWCPRPTCFYNRPGERPARQRKQIPNYALDEYSAEDFFSPSSSSFSSSSLSSSHDPGDSDYIDTHRNSLRNPHFVSNINTRDGFNVIANKDYFALITHLHNLKPIGTRIPLSSLSASAGLVKAGVNSLLRGVSVSLFNTAQFHAELRLILLLCVQLRVCFLSSSSASLLAVEIKTLNTLVI